jgi:hypothetical protein
MRSCASLINGDGASASEFKSRYANNNNTLFLLTNVGETTKEIYSRNPQ